MDLKLRIEIPLEHDTWSTNAKDMELVRNSDVLVINIEDREIEVDYDLISRAIRALNNQGGDSE